VPRQSELIVIVVELIVRHHQQPRADHDAVELRFGIDTEVRMCPRQPGREQCQQVAGSLLSVVLAGYHDHLS
jgi:hypothetical protein